MNAIAVAARRRAEETSSDFELAGLARDGDEPAIRLIVRRHNQQLFRVARSIVRNDAEAEDVVQATYVKAFTSLASFRGEAQLATWLTRIALNEALGRLRRRHETTGLEELEMTPTRRQARIIHLPTSMAAPDPEVELSRSQARRFLEKAVDGLPLAFRSVFVLRDVHGMSVEETAQQLDLKPETVKTRLFRARKLMRAAIEKEFTGAFSALFPFDGARCANMADSVVAALRER